MKKISLISIVLLLWWQNYGVTVNGQRLYFDGDKDFVQVPNYAAASSLGYSNFTLEALISVTGTAPFYYVPIISTMEDMPSADTSCKIGYIMYLNAQGKLSFGMRSCLDFQYFEYTEGPDLTNTTNTFRHVAVTRSGTSIKFYIDGALVKTYTTSNVFYLTNTNRFYIGVDVYDQKYFNASAKGFIQQVRVWNVERNSASINTNRSGCLSGGEAGLIGNFEMSEGGGHQDVYNNATGFTNRPGILGFIDITETQYDPKWQNNNTSYGNNTDLTFSVSNQFVCSSSSVTFSASGTNYLSYSWQSPDGTISVLPGGTSIKFKPYTGKNYPSVYLTAIKNNGCENKVVNAGLLTGLVANGLSTINSVTGESDDLLGVGYSGGNYGAGTIYKYNKNTNAISLLQHFTGTGVGKNGFYPESYLTKFNGKYYGLASMGGQYDKGTLFEYDPVANSLTAVYHFNDKGIYPKGHLLEYNGKLYGMTSAGVGVNQHGNIFEWSPSSPKTINVKASFTHSTGINPGGSLRLYNGKMYGMASEGGTNNKGTLFEVNLTTFNISVLHAFTGISGANPYGNDVVLYSNKLYGITYAGGQNDVGVLFEYNLSNSQYTKHLDFGGSNGANPPGMLTLYNNKFYGLVTTRDPNSFSPGNLFEWNPTTLVFSTKVQFTDAYPMNSLTVSGGKLYTTATSMSRGQGLVLKWDPNTEVLTQTSLGPNDGDIVTANLNLIEAYQGNAICKNDGYIRTYTANANPGPQGTYNWTVPAGATVLSGINTNQIKVSFLSSATTGNISVNASNTCGTTNTVTYNFVVNDCAGSGTGPRVALSDEAETDTEAYELYPNPTTGMVYVKATAPLKVSICDLTGRTVKLADLNQTNNFSIDLSNCPKGLYVLKVLGTEKSQLVTLE